MAAVGLYFRWTARHQQGGRLEMEGVELGRRTRRHHISLAPWSAEVEPCGWICVWFLEAEYIRRLSGEKEGEMRLTTQVRWVNGGKPNEIPRLTMPPNGTVLQQYCSYYISGSLVFFFFNFFYWQCWAFVSVHGLQGLGLSDCGGRAELLHGTWNLQGPGVKLCVPCIDREILIHWPTREVLAVFT